MGYLQIKDLEVSFPTPKGTYTAIRDIDLSVPQGEIIALIGHSGCGKSTLLNVIGGMTKPTSGTVMLNQKPIKGPGPDRGIVFQNYSLLPWLTAYQNIFEAVDSVMKDKTKAEKRDIVENYLNVVHLWKHKDKLPSEISGGMKQRVAIARAFAINPNVLLLDEPFGALDALTKATLHEELMQLWQLDEHPKTIVMVTHDIEEAIYLADRVVVMTNGPAATIGEIVNVPLPRPREKKSIVLLPEYAEVRAKLLYLLTDAYSLVEEEVH